MNPCTRSAYTSAAGRNYIARKDKTLDQAYAAYDKHEYATALSTFRLSYDRVGWDEAALMLGAMYDAGQGTPRDPKQAIAWYTKLAQAKLEKAQFSVFDPAAPEQATARIEAQVRLAQAYMAGNGVERDPARARYWYRQASDLNYIPARFTLARMLQSGYGGAQDAAGARALYASAAEAGYVPAQVTLAALVRSSEPQKAFAWYQRAAVNKLAGRYKAQAQYALAESYDQGAGVTADPARALTYYKLAAVAGHPEAQNSLATYFYNGQQVAKDLPLARKLFLTAASQGQDGAMVNAAAMLYRGEGGGKDAVQALAWLKLAAKMGNEKAAKGAAALEGKLTVEERARADTVVKGTK
jgi:TPR repeat protein